MSDIDEKVAAARSDISRLRVGWRPSENDLTGAVFLKSWLISTNSQGLPVLIGNAVEHPRLGTQLITTSPLLWLDEEQMIARTLSRWYRLNPTVTDRTNGLSGMERSDVRRRSNRRRGPGQI